MESWPYQGVPENPVGWLYTVARNQTKNYLQRKQIFREKILPNIQTDGEFSLPDLDLSESNILDSQLQMLFVICHPSLSKESQVSLALRILCGFGNDEIASAFLTNKETINKRLYRAKERLRKQKIKPGVPSEPEIGERLDSVLTTLYLVYSEGYYSESGDTLMRKDLCLEAMRLTRLLTENNMTSRPEVNALLALMSFHASRFEARQDENGNYLLYDDQDRNHWNHDLIAQGIYYLHLSSHGSELSKYHLEAALAYWYAVKEDTSEKWEKILHLLRIDHNPFVILNRIFAI